MDGPDDGADAHGVAVVPPLADADGWAGHAAAVVGSEEELLGEALTFLQQGLADDDLVVLGCHDDLAVALARALGARASAVELNPRVRLLGNRAPEIFTLVRALAERAAGRGSGRLRVLAQVDFGRTPRELHEGQCFEAVANTLDVPAALSSLCLYDVRRLPPDLVRSAGATHTHLVDGGVRRRNDRFVDPSQYVRSLPVVHEPVEDGEPLLALDDAPTLPALRHAMGDALATAVPDRDQREDLHLALSEMAANAFRHGGRPVSVRMWADASRLVARISDGGGGVRDPLFGYWPAHGQDLGRGGMGLWLARKLCDHVDLLPAPSGLTVRINTALR